MTGEIAPGLDWARIGRYLDAAALLKVIPVSRNTLDNWLAQGHFPQPSVLGGKRLWPEILVERYLQSQVSIAPNQAALDAAAAASDAARRAMGPLPEMIRSIPPLPEAALREGERIAEIVAKAARRAPKA